MQQQQQQQQHLFLNNSDPFHAFMFKDNEHLPQTDFDLLLGATAAAPPPPHTAQAPTTTTMRMTRSRSALQMSSLIAQQQQQQESNVGKDENTNPVVPSGWKVVHMDKALLGEDCHFRLTIRSKGEQETSTLPENLYSSIKYHIGHRVSGSFLKNNRIEELSVRLQIVNPDTLYEMKQNNKAIVRGVVESTCIPLHKQKTSNSKQKNQQQQSPVNDDEISTSMKIQLTSCSYHHARAKFAIMASYYRNGYHEQPIMVVISSPFLCFARKPQMKKAGNRRRTSAATSSSSSVSTTPAATDSDVESVASSSPGLTGVKRRRSNSSTESIDGIYSDDECPNTVRVDRTLVEKYKDVEAKKARYAHQAAAQFPSHSEQFKNFVASLEELFDSFPNASDSERTEASSLVVRKLLQLTDCEDQSYVDQHLSLHSPEPNSLQQTNMQSQFPSFPSSASYSSLLALTEQQLSPFDITEQLVNDEMSSTTASASIIYSLTGATDI